MKRIVLTTFILLALLFSLVPAVAAGSNGMIGINVVLNTGISDTILTDLGTHGKVRDIVPEINAVTLQARTSELTAIQALPYVASANEDAQRYDYPIQSSEVTVAGDGVNTWDLDAINITNKGTDPIRTVQYDGTDVYVAVLDTGLVDNWRFYFPEERIATEYAMAFNGGGGDNGNVSTPTNKWEHDQNSHGTHVTSTILGYTYPFSTGIGLVNGVAPMATVIPVKVLNQNGSGWSSVIARGIMYVAELKEGPLADHPVVINMSLGGPSLDPMEEDAIDYAVAAGVIIVASAGNNGTRGMGYPGAYAPVISVAASGWIREWTAASWWRTQDVPDPNDADQYYIADFSSRQLAGQDLDVSAPGTWIVGPYQKNGQLSWYYLGGTSMASPHVAGLVALMAEKNPALTAADAETILEDTAFDFGTGCRSVLDPNTGAFGNICWEADATGFGLVDAAEALK